MIGRARRDLVELAVAALDAHEPDQLVGEVAEVLMASLDAGYAIGKSQDWQESGPQTLDLRGPGGRFPGRLDGEVGRSIRRGRPFVGRLAAGERGPMSACEVAGERSWRATRDGSVLREGLDCRDVLALPLDTPGSRSVHGWLLFRSGAAFAEADLEWARTAQPLLAAVDRHRTRLRRIREGADPAPPLPLPPSTPAAPATTPTTAPLDGAPAVGERAGDDPVARAKDVGLTARETVVLAELARSLPASAIGRRLGISTRTVHKHLESLYRKLGTRDRLATVLRAQQLGLLPWARP